MIELKNSNWDLSKNLLEEDKILRKRGGISLKEAKIDNLEASLESCSYYQAKNKNKNENMLVDHA